MFRTSISFQVVRVPGVGWKFAFRSIRVSGAEGGGGGPAFMEKDLLENVIPLVEKEYRVAKDADHRAIAGLSMGGNQALTIGLNNLSRFAYVAGFSSGGGGNNANSYKSLLADPDKSNKQLKLLWIGCGQDDDEDQDEGELERDVDGVHDSLWSARRSWDTPVTTLAATVGPQSGP
jgi:predicted alpha/beta superfamily hydrolase